MANKVFLHIGLPKTATTYLQTNLALSLNGTKIMYLGVKHPRETIQHDIYRKIMFSLMNDDNSNEKVTEIRSMIENELLVRSVVISEEMFLVSSKSITWQEKLSKLSEIFKELNVEIIVTTRSPEKLAYSLYVEFYRGHHHKYPNYSDFICDLSNPYLEPLHYKRLHAVLTKKFPLSRIHYLPYELLCNDKDAFILMLSNIFGTQFSLGSTRKENVKLASSEGYYSEPKKLTSIIGKMLAFVGLQRPLQRVLNKSKTARYLRKYYHGLIGSISISQRKIIPYPSDEDNALIEKLFHDDIKFLAKQ